MSETRFSFRLLPSYLYGELTEHWPQIEQAQASAVINTEKMARALHDYPELPILAQAWQPGDQLEFYEDAERRLKPALARNEARYAVIDGELTSLSALQTAEFPRLELSGLGESHYALVAALLRALGAGRRWERMIRTDYARSMAALTAQDQPVWKMYLRMKWPWQLLGAFTFLLLLLSFGDALTSGYAWARSASWGLLIPLAGVVWLQVRSYRNLAPLLEALKTGRRYQFRTFRDYSQSLDADKLEVLQAVWEARWRPPSFVQVQATSPENIQKDTLKTMLDDLDDLEPTSAEEEQRLQEHRRRVEKAIKERGKKKPDLDQTLTYQQAYLKEIGEK